MSSLKAFSGFGCCLLQLHFLKTDFNRWRDEDDSEEEEKEDFNLDEVCFSLILPDLESLQFLICSLLKVIVLKSFWLLQRTGKWWGQRCVVVIAGKRQ